MLSLKLGVVYAILSLEILQYLKQVLNIWPRTQSPNLSFSNAVDTVCATTPDHCLEICCRLQLLNKSSLTLLL